MISASNPHFEGVYVIDDFQSYEVDQFPNEWKGRKKKAKKEYTIQMEENNKYLQAESHNSDMFILKKCNVDATKFQYLNWKWRVHEIPENGNESVKKQCDTPATIAVIFRLSKWRPKSLKYTFSSTLPPMTTTKSPYAKWPARTDILVLRNKDSGLGNWISEKQNVLEDYKKIRDVKEFDKLKIEGILIMTDSDNTKSSARADYDDIFFSIE
ncbi:MAG: DUF3047 domain-containing protein [Bacteroidota bacterium]